MQASRLVLLVTVLVSTPVAAWEVKSLYPSAVVPRLPAAEEAQALVDSPGPFGALGEAHRRASALGWAALPSVDDATDRVGSADGSPPSGRDRPPVEHRAD